MAASFLTPITFIHELGHALVFKYYHKFEVREIILHSQGGAATYMTFIDSLRSVVGSGSKDAEGLAAGPLLSAAVHTFGLVYLSKLSREFNSLNRIQMFYHESAILVLPTNEYL